MRSYTREESECSAKNMQCSKLEKDEEMKKNSQNWNWEGKEIGKRRKTDNENLEVTERKNHRLLYECT